MKELFRTLPVVCLVILIPVVPFLAFGWHAESWLRGYSEGDPSVASTSAVVMGLLASDIFLPVPSSMVSTLAGWQLGWLRGTLAVWIGMTLGAALGFAVARRFGMNVARWFSREETLERMGKLTETFGGSLLVLTRAVPVFAEASVLMVGIHRLHWRKFLPPVILSNLGVALAYAAFGDLAERYKWFPLALGVSVAVPVLLTAAARWILGTGSAVGSAHVDLGDVQDDPDQARQDAEEGEEVVPVAGDAHDAHGEGDEGQDQEGEPPEGPQG